MNCPVCAEKNPEGNLFCGNCGAVLDAGGFKLRQQILGVIKNEFEPQELSAVKVADRALKRIWMGLGIVTVLAVYFGVNTFHGAQERIKEVTDNATTKIEAASAKTEQAITDGGAAAVGRLQEQSRASADQLTKSSRSGIASLNARISNDKDQISSLEAEVADSRARYAALNTLRSTLPNTPIGDLNGVLFSSASTVLNSTPANVNSSVISGVTNLNASSLIAPYKEGDSGNGVREIQNRLATLGCYTGAVTGNFDSDTSLAVEKFKALSGAAFLAYSGSGNFDPYMPTALILSSSPDAVDYNLWQLMFSSSPQRCIAS